MPTGRRSFRVLLVEDNPGDARLLRELLRDAGLAFELRHVAQLADAVSLVPGEEVDVILLDLSLPDAHGMETVRRMLEAAPAAAIVVLTGLDDQELAVEAVRAGAQDYLVKGQVEPPLLGRALRYARQRKTLELERAELLHREQEARALAEAAVRARDEVLRVVSHDLGNSLTAVSIQARLLERLPAERLQPEELRRRAGAIRHLVASMQRLRQDLLDVASIEAGRLSIEPAAVDAVSLAAEALELHSDVAAEKSLELRSRQPGELPRVYGDRDRLLQVLSNLLGNAVKFTPEGGRVELRAEPVGAMIRFSVVDSGPGIPEEELAHVFDRFWKSRRGNPHGAGLGLAIARGIVEAHGGSIWAESEPGVGSTFHFIVPTSTG